MVTPSGKWTKTAAQLLRGSPMNLNIEAAIDEGWLSKVCHAIDYRYSGHFIFVRLEDDSYLWHCVVWDSASDLGWTIHIYNKSAYDNDDQKGVMLSMGKPSRANFWTTLKVLGFVK